MDIATPARISARRLRLTGAAGAMVLAVTLASCAGGSESADQDRSNFPVEDFPAETFDGLTGTLAWYDGSGGATTKVRQETIFGDFTALTGVSMQPDYTGDTSKFFAAAEGGGDLPWSLVEFPTQGDYLKARDAGYLEKIDTSKVPVERLEKGTYDDSGIEVMRYGIVLTYNTDRFPESGPRPDNLTDLYDTERFPGRRCMLQYPQFGGTLESALLADGVAPDDLYPLDVKRALRKLDTIKDDIVWFGNGDEALRLLTSGECDLGVGYSGRVFSRVEKDDSPLAISWNNAIYTSAVYAVPKGAPNPDAGQAALAMWLLDSEGQQKFMTELGYMPAIMPDLEYPENLKPWLPIGENVETAIQEDAEYYAANIADLSSEFNAWVSRG